MLSAKVVNYNRQPYIEQPIYDAYTIASTIRALKIYPEFTKRYLSETVEYEGQIVPAHSDRNIENIARICSEQKELTDRLLSDKKKNFSTGEIFSIVLSYKKAPEFVEKLLKENRAEFSDSPRFNGDEISALTTLYKQYPELVGKIIFQVNPDIFESKRFSLDDIENIVELYKNDSEKVNYILYAKREYDYDCRNYSDGGFIFYANQIKEALDFYEKNPKLMKLLVEAPDCALVGYEILDIFKNIDEKYYPAIEKVLAEDIKNPLDNDYRAREYNDFLREYINNEDFLSVGAIDKLDIDKLSKSEKKSLLCIVLKNKNKCNPNLKRISELLPENQEEYTELIKKLAKSLDLKIEKLNKKEQEDFEKEILLILMCLKTLSMIKLFAQVT